MLLATCSLYRYRSICVSERWVLKMGCSRMGVVRACFAYRGVWDLASSAKSATNHTAQDRTVQAHRK